MRGRGAHFFAPLFLIGCFLFLSVNFAFSAPPASSAQKSSLEKLDVEITEVEELKDPYGAAIYTVKDLGTGKVLRLFVDPRHSLIQLGGKVVAAGDALGGSKATIIYQKVPDKDMPEVVFARVSSSYYS